MTSYDPFAVLGLPARPDLSDDEVRAAWRRIAARTHPDLPDGGDTVRFAAAAAAYETLRTGYGRSEAYADLREAPRATGATGATAAVARSRTASADTGTAAFRLAAALVRSRFIWRVRRGRPGILTLRLLIAIGLCWGGVAVAGWQPTTLAITVGVLTWFIRTARYDLAAPPR